MTKKNTDKVKKAPKVAKATKGPKAEKVSKAAKAPKKTPKVKAAPVTTAETNAAPVSPAPVAETPVAAVKVAPVAEAKPEIKVELMACPVCSKEKPIKGFVTLAEVAGAANPETGVKCDDCFEDLIAAAKANGTEIEQHFNLLESRERDAKTDKHAKYVAMIDQKIKTFAWRQDKSLVCKHPGCRRFHGQYDHRTGRVTVLEALVPVFDERQYQQDLPAVVDTYCQGDHMRTFVVELRKAAGNPKLRVDAKNVLEVVELVRSVNNWRASERNRVEAAREKKRVELAAKAALYTRPVEHAKSKKAPATPQHHRPVQAQPRVDRPAKPQAPVQTPSAPAAASAAKPVPAKAENLSAVEKFNRKYGMAPKPSVRREDLREVHTGELDVEDKGDVTRVIVGNELAEVGEPSGKTLFGKLAEGSSVDLR